MIVALPLASALCYALATVLQQRAAAEVPRRYSMRLGLLGHLLRRPLWLVGVGADVCGFGFEAAALAIGSLSVVQPLLVLGFPLALLVAACLTTSPLGWGEWMGAGAVTTGVVVFVAVASPSRGTDSAPGARWVVVAMVLGAVTVLSVAGATFLPRWRATMLAVATGVVFALSAALTKTVASLLGRDHIAVLAHGETYALIVVGAVSVLLVQSAFQAGDLRASLPALTLIPPLVSLPIGVYLFAERASTTGVRLPLEIVAAMTAGFGVIALGRSPLARLAYESTDETAAGRSS